MVTILVHIVAWNSSDALLHRSVESIENQDYTGKIQIEITDNGSTDGTLAIIGELEKLHSHLRVYSNSANLGFCGAHNQAIARFLNGPYDLFLALNPDAFLETTALSHMVAHLQTSSRIGAITPKLLRCTSDGSPSAPPVIDAAGMCLTRSLRHFDRGSGEVDHGQWDVCDNVFGGTGACLLLTRGCVEDLLLYETSDTRTALLGIFPQLADSTMPRNQLFDEAFFAFREDADLAWRMQIRGFDCAYVPSALAYHVRRVVPERRSELPDVINRHGVRNRFLLQLNNLPLRMPIGVFLNGVLARNLIVFLAVLFYERASLGAIREILCLSKRALQNRRKLFNKSGSDMYRAMRWTSF